MRLFLIAGAVGLVTLPTNLPAQAGPQVKYRRWGMFGGYKEKSLGPTSWKVLAGVNGIAPEGSAAKIALYRAAELTKLAGYRYFQIVNQKGSQTYFGVGGPPTHRGGGSAELQIVAVNDPTPPSACLADRSELCVTVEVEKAMELARPYLKFPD